MPVVVKDRIWPFINYHPHEGQCQIHNSTARHRLASCGRRFGKSTVGGNELVPEAAYTYSIIPALEQLGKQRRFWIVGPDYSDVEKEWRVIWDAIKRLGMPLDKPGSYNNPHMGDMHMSLWNGRFQIHGKSAMHPESLDGEGLFGVLLVEAAKLKRIIWGKFLRPALSDEGGWSLKTSTPEGKNWFYEEYLRGQDPSQPQYESWRKPSWENPILFPEGRQDPEILDMESDMSPELFNQEIAADFTEFVGRVFKGFDADMHVKDIAYDPSLPLYGACDYGWTNPFVWLAIQVDVFDNVYVLGEYRESHRDINDIGRDLLDWPLAANAIKLYPDPAEPGDTRVLEKVLKLKADTNTGGELKWRLELIREKLKLDPESEGHDESLRQPKLFIDRKCTGLINEMEEYRYPDSRTESVRAEPEKPLDKDDHGPEALGRFMRGYYGGPGDEMQGSNAKVRKAVISSG